MQKSIFLQATLALQSVRNFVRIDLMQESAPDATTLLKFRRLLEANDLMRRVFNEINGRLANKGLMMREVTIVNATLIAASPSTKNRDKERDPGVHQSMKGNDWHSGMRAHLGVDCGHRPGPHRRRHRWQRGRCDTRARFAARRREGRTG